MRVEGALVAVVGLTSIGEAVDLIERVDFLRQLAPHGLLTVSRWLLPEAWRVAVFLVGIGGLAALKLKRLDGEHAQRNALLAFGFALFLAVSCFTSSRADHPLGERHIRPEDARRLHRILNTDGRRNLVPVTINYYPNTESERFADELRRIFIDGWWQSPPPAFVTFPKPWNDEGVYFIYASPTNDNERSTAVAFCNALRIAISDSHCGEQQLTPQWRLFVGQRRTYPDDANGGS